MNTGLKLTINSTSSGNTEAVGQKFGRNLRGGEVIELVSDLGGGKTTFVRGLARGAGSKDDVASPTFTISRVYNAPALTIYHFDFYRLNDPGIMKYEIAELATDPQNVIVVEWANIIKDTFKTPPATIKIDYSANEARLINISLAPGQEYLLKGIK
jgi:tRNA threonylcarbamoyladenosine biosynthesis protein TsaE